MEIKTKSPIETKKVAEQFSKELFGGEIIALYGNLGAGKTVFVQGIAKGLKIKRNITSPTFVFMRTYPVKIKGRDLNFYHLDLYRGNNTADFEALGLGEIFTDDSIVVLEWAERLKNKLPKKRIDIEISVVNEKTRKIKIKRNK